MQSNEDDEWDDWDELDQDDEDDWEADLVDCPACGQPVHELTDRCPHCGDYIVTSNHRPPVQQRRLNWVVYLMLLALLLPFLLILVRIIAG